MLYPFFGERQLSKIATFDVERYKKSRAGEAVMRANGPGGKPAFGDETKPATINRELAALSHLFSKAVEWGWVDHRPATIKRLKEHSGRITYLTVEQIERLLKVAEGDQSRQNYTNAHQRKKPATDKVAGFLMPIRLVMAPRPGLEPGTYGLTVRRSTN